MQRSPPWSIPTFWPWHCPALHRWSHEEHLSSVGTFPRNLRGLLMSPWGWENVTRAEPSSGWWEKLTWRTWDTGDHHGDKCPPQGRDSGGPHGSGRVLGGSLWPIVHPGVLEELGGQDVPSCHRVHPVPHALAPPGPGPAPPRSAWPCWTHARASHVLLVLLDPSWVPASPPGPPEPILEPIINSWAHLGSHHQLLDLS